jgi:DNA repair exonuclease SbcCD nuclease subunit
MVDERQANGIRSSNDNVVYHLFGTPYTFEGEKRTVHFEEIDAEEYERLTQQVKKNERLEERVRELEKMLREIYLKLS